MPGLAPRILLTVLLSLVLGLVHAQERADEESPLKGEMKGFLVVEGENGAERLVEAAEILPGQMVEYVITYTNTGDKPLREVKVGGLVPEQTRYVPESATTTRWRRPLFSLDDGQTFQPEPVRYEVRLANGEKEERIATPDMYTQVRWVIRRLPAGARVEFRYRVMLEE
jgi:uncharacterized repeat protein (TIGR01451 family)